MSWVRRRNPMVWVIASIFALNLLGGTTLLGLDNNPSEASSTLPVIADDIERGSFTVDEAARQGVLSQLAGGQGIEEITWSPDGSATVYVRKNGNTGNAYLRRVGDKGERLLGSYPTSAYGFFWAPDSKHLLLAEKGSDGARSRIIRSDTLIEVAPRISSALIPLWSPDGKHLAAAGLERDKSGAWATIRVYTLGKRDSICLLSTPYLHSILFIEYWDKDGIIGYSEVNGKGERISKTISAPK